MITEQERSEQDKKSIDQIKKECQEIIRASARYERLESNQDWIDSCKDLENLIEIHKSQIEGALTQFAEAAFLDRFKIEQFIIVHQIRMEQIKEAINYPKRIIHQANEAREWLAEHKGDL